VLKRACTVLRSLEAAPGTAFVVGDAEGDGVGVTAVEDGDELLTVGLGVGLVVAFTRAGVRASPEFFLWLGFGRTEALAVGDGVTEALGDADGLLGGAAT
jgi:hypothetical protein